MLSKKIALPSCNELRAILHYVPSTGLLFWKVRPQSMFADERAWKSWNSKNAGNRAFATSRRDGYFVGAIHNQILRAHRVVFKLVHGTDPDQIDHIDGDPKNNRIGNLRSVSHAENQRNVRRHSRNKSGVTGVVWYRPLAKWHAQIAVVGKVTHLGYFEDFDGAVAARKAAEIKYGYHANHGRVQSVLELAP